ncbi:hypothetical protein EGW08_001907, partial [Elysia chlorotica]
MRCSWGNCKSDYRYPERCVGIKFIPFVQPARTKPWNHAKCLRWIKACGKPYDRLNIDKVNKNHYICSKHFVDGAPTPENPDPIQAEVTPETFSSSKRKLPKKSSEPVATKIRINEAAKILLSFKEQVVPAVTNVSDLTDDSSKKQQAGVGETDTPEVASEQDVESDAANGANILESAPLEPTSADRDVRPQQKVESFVSCSNCGQDVLLNPSKLRELQKETLKHHVVASNQKCREYTGLPSVDLLNFLFDRLDNTEAVVGLCEQNQGEELYGRRNKGHKMSRFDCL